MGVPVTSRWAFGQRLRTCSERDRQIKPRKRKKILRVSKEKDCPLPLLLVQAHVPCLPKEKGHPQPLRPMGCYPQAPFLQEALLPESQPPHQLRGLLAWFWMLLRPQGIAKQLSQGVQLPRQCVHPLLQGLVGAAQTQLQVTQDHVHLGREGARGLSC